MTSPLSASPDLRVAIVGAGYWGRNLARNFAELGALAAVVDTDPATVAEVSAMTGAPARDWEDILADSGIAGVAIATRAETHYALAVRAIEAGKHVFVEKPLVLDEDQADRLIELAAERARVLMVGHLLRYHPVFGRMLDLVRSGDFGELNYICSDRLSLGKIRTEENVLWSFAPHDISMILALAGEEPECVSAQTAAFVNPAIADWATMQLAFASGVRADIRASWMHYRKTQRIVAICERATIVFEDSEPEWTNKLAIHEHRIDIEKGVPVPKRGKMRLVEVPRDEPLKLECQHFIDCMSTGSAPVTDGAEGRAVLRVLQMASAAIAANR